MCPCWTHRQLGSDNLHGNRPGDSGLMVERSRSKMSCTWSPVSMLHRTSCDNRLARSFIMALGRNPETEAEGKLLRPGSCICLGVARCSRTCISYGSISLGWSVLECIGAPIWTRYHTEKLPSTAAQSKISDLAFVDSPVSKRSGTGAN